MSEDSNTVVTLKVRVTPEFREKIVETAKSNNRSMNQEIVARLEKSFDDEDLPWLTNTNKEYLTKIKSIEEKLDQIINNTGDLLGDKKAP